VDDPEEAAHGDTAEKADKVASRRPILKYRKVLSVGQKGGVEGIKTDLKNGVLTVRIPMKKELEPRKIDIQG